MRVLLNLLLFLLVLNVCKRHEIQIIQVRNWIWGGFCAYLSARLLRLHFVFQWSFPLHDAVALVNKVEKKGIAALKSRITNRLRRLAVHFLMEKAEIVFPISEEMKARLVQEGYKASKLIPIPLGFSANTGFVNGEITRIRETIGLRGEKIILYVGTLHYLRQPEFMLRVYKLLMKEKLHAKLVVVGGTPAEVRRLMNHARELGISKGVHFVGNIPRRFVHAYILNADVCLSPIPQIPLYMVSSPTKLIEYLGAGKPAVASRIPEQEKILLESGGGICVDFVEEHFAKAISYLLKNKRVRMEMGRKAREYAVRHRSYEKLADTIEEIYAAVSN